MVSSLEPKTEKVTGDWRKLYNGNFLNLYILFPSYWRGNHGDKMAWACRTYKVARNAYTILAVKY